MKYIYDLHKIMLARSLILVYEGEFTQEITKSVLSMAERNMDSFGESSKVKRKVFNIMVECLQNICKHADNLERFPGENNAIFMIGKDDDSYVITSGNAVHRADVSEIIRKLEYINTLDKEGLKFHYRQEIKSKRGNPLSEKGGAGLGFIDMARKSGRKLGFDFEDINEELSFFSLRTTIPRNL